MAKKKIVIHFPEETIEKPITYHLVKDFGLVPNILRAQIDENEGMLVMDLEGSIKKINQALDFLKEQRVIVQEAQKDLIINRDTCVDCGSCTSVCRPNALTIGPDDWKLNFEPEKCVFCELCINACPTRSIKLHF